VTVPRIRYARHEGQHIAYQVVGDGPQDVVFISDWVWNVELFWEEPDSCASSGASRPSHA
jgi:hypothetical protein